MGVKMKLLNKLSTLARSLARGTRPRQTQDAKPSPSDEPPQAYTEEGLPTADREYDHGQGEKLEWGRVADLLHDKLNGTEARPPQDGNGK